MFLTTLLASFVDTDDFEEAEVRRAFFELYRSKIDDIAGFKVRPVRGMLVVKLSTRVPPPAPFVGATVGKKVGRLEGALVGRNDG